MIADGNVKTDEFLIEKVGPIEVDNQVIYGDVDVNGDESEALCLPSNYAMHEMLNLKDFELDLNTSGVKMRWKTRELDENAGIPLSDDQIAQHILESRRWD